MSDKSANQIAANEAVTLDRRALKFGGALAVLGGLGYFVTLLLREGNTTRGYRLASG